jgi:hypothetical protein
MTRRLHAASFRTTRERLSKAHRQRPRLAYRRPVSAPVSLHTAKGEEDMPSLCHRTESKWINRQSLAFDRLNRNWADWGCWNPWTKLAASMTWPDAGNPSLCSGSAQGRRGGRGYGAATRCCYYLGLFALLVNALWSAAGILTLSNPSIKKCPD